MVGRLPTYTLPPSNLPISRKPPDFKFVTSQCFPQYFSWFLVYISPWLQTGNNPEEKIFMSQAAIWLVKYINILISVKQSYFNWKNPTNKLISCEIITIMFPLTTLLVFCLHFRRTTESKNLSEPESPKSPQDLPKRQNTYPNINQLGRKITLLSYLQVREFMVEKMTLPNTSRVKATQMSPRLSWRPKNEFFSFQRSHCHAK